MDKRKKGYLWIALGVVCLVVMVGVAVVGGLAYVVYQQFALKQTVIEPADAAKELDQLRAEFHDPPRLQFAWKSDGRPDVTLRKPQTPSTVSLTAMHVTAFDPKERHLVRATVPFWLLRLTPEWKMRMNGAEMMHYLNTPGGRLTPADIEALGPGLLVDDKQPDGTQVLIWTE
ncbi:MAG TPA: hypothetical protein VJ260_06955 [Vicinamibacterales bacterium]|nr:hypothetical protein [Vicinamibacterales bacterium]